MIFFIISEQRRHGLARHVKDIRNGTAVQPHFKGVGPKTFAITRWAFDQGVRQELQLDALVTGPVAYATGPGLAVKREVPRGKPQRLGLGRRGETFPQGVQHPKVRGDGHPTAGPEGTLIHKHHLGDMVGTPNRVTSPQLGSPVAQGPVQMPIDDRLDKRRLADPLTPVTHTKRPSGNDTDTSFRLFSRPPQPLQSAKQRPYQPPSPQTKVRLSPTPRPQQLQAQTRIHSVR